VPPPTRTAAWCRDTEQESLLARCAPNHIRAGRLPFSELVLRYSIATGLLQAQESLKVIASEQPASGLVAE
jgi:hypothetical protein